MPVHFDQAIWYVLAIKHLSYVFYAIYVLESVFLLLFFVLFFSAIGRVDINCLNTLVWIGQEVLAYSRGISVPKQSTAFTNHVRKKPRFWKYQENIYSLWAETWGRILTIIELRMRGWTWTIPNNCPLCLKDVETNDHLMLHCEFSSNIWNHFNELIDCYKSNASYLTSLTWWKNVPGSQL